MGAGTEHGDGPGPFAQFELTGADVHLLAALVAGKGDLATGLQRLTDLFVYLSNLHLEGANLIKAQLQRALLSEAQLQGADLVEAQ